MTFDVAISVYFFQSSFAHDPTSGSGLAGHFGLIPCLFEEHAEAIERHRFFDAAPGDEFVGDFGSSHGKKRKKAPESAF